MQEGERDASRPAANANAGVFAGQATQEPDALWEEACAAADLGADAGALSQAQGRVTIDCRTTDGDISIGWQEIGGPKVAPPAAQNFGSKLILVTLSQIDAQLEPSFCETGYCYRIVLPREA